MQITIEHLGLTMFFLAFTWFWVPPVWLLIHVLPPTKRLKDHYFKKPHFTSAELSFLNIFPGSFIRTVVFMGLAGWPKRGVKRQMTDVRNYTPSWYVVVSQWFVCLSMIHGLLGLSLLVGLSIHMEFIQ